MKKLLCAAALALSFGAASPMVVKYNGKTGKMIEYTIHDEGSINPRQAGMIGKITELQFLSCNITVLDNGKDDPRGDITLYLSW